MVKLVNRAKMSTATTGTGTITLGTAESGYQSFAGAGVVNGDVVRYVIEDGNNWEIGTGTFTALGLTLTRTVSESSNSGSPLVLTGNAVVYVSATAEDIPPAYTNSDVDTHLNAGTAASGEVLSWTGTDYDWISAGGGAALELYAENPVTPTAPVATGSNAVAIGSESVSVGTRSIALGDARASGTDSFAAAIANNTSTYGASNDGSVALTQLARASGLWSSSIGYLAQATGSTSLALGPNSTASGLRATAVQGGNASAERSFAFGLSSKAQIYGKFAFGARDFGANSIYSQEGLYILLCPTTNDTPAVLTTNNSAASTINQIILPNNSAHAFHGTIVARQQASAGTACAAWKIEGLIRREGTAATTVLVNSATTVLDNTPAWGMALSADTTNGGLRIQVTGAAAINIRWVATVHTSEVTF